MKHITILLAGLAMVSCNNSPKNVANSNSSPADTVKQVSGNRTTANYPDNAIYIGQKINDFISLARQRYDVKKELIQLEGNNYDIYNVYDSREKIFAVEPDFDKPDIVWRIWMYSTELQTEKGVGVGSTLADIQTNYPDANIGIEEGLHVKVKGITFLMDGSQLPENWWKSMDYEKIPKDLPVDEMIIWDTTYCLTLDKTIKQLE